MVLFLRFILLAGAVFGPLAAAAQLDPLSRPSTAASPLSQPTLSTGTVQLMKLDADFAKDVAKNGGKAFTQWFADDAVTLNNAKAPVFGKANITAGANWNPKDYQLTWTPQGAQMGPSGDMGFTWGHFESHAKDQHGNDVSNDGRYITVWKRTAAGAWKIALDASANEPPTDCCKLPTP